MTKQYRMRDNAKAPQTVSIHWEKIEEPDDSQDRPDERVDGFWPSRNPKNAGYVVVSKFDAEQAKATSRMEAWERGDWCYVGIIARVHISIPIGGGSFVNYTLDSPGLWGVESENESASYRLEIFEEQKAELLSHLKSLCSHLG